MPRRNPLPPNPLGLPTDESGLVLPVSVASLITFRQAKESRGKRKRDWEKKNPSSSYRIPTELHIQAKDIRASILVLAEQHMTNASNIANAMLVYSLAHVRQGSLKIEPRPKPERRKMALILVEADGWPQEIPQGTKKRAAKNVMKTAVTDLILTYRWSREVSTQIEAIAGRRDLGRGGGAIPPELCAGLLQERQIEVSGRGGQDVPKGECGMVVQNPVRRFLAKPHVFLKTKKYVSGDGYMDATCRYLPLTSAAYPAAYAICTGQPVSRLNFVTGHVARLEKVARSRAYCEFYQIVRSKPKCLN
jgi:hypothetical protein